MSPAVARLIVSRLLSLTSNTSTYLFNSYPSAGSEPRACTGRVFLVGAPLGPRQVDAEGLRGAEGVLVELADLDLLARLVHDADVEAERLHLLDEHLEGLGDSRFGNVLALHDRLVHLHAAEDRSEERRVGKECRA